MILKADVATPLPKANNVIVDMVVDSRQIKPGDIFLAYPGFYDDGRKYIDAAIANGASKVISESQRDKISAIAAEHYDYPGNKLTIIGVTGTNGKTSVCYLTAQALTKLGVKCAIIGTLGNGIWPNLDSANRTTPDPASIQKQFAEFVAAGVTHVVMEVSSHALDQSRVYLPDFDIAVFTNLTRDHLDYHGSMQDYFAAKQKLFQAPNLQAVILNENDLSSRGLTTGSSKIIWYSKCPTNLLGEFNQANIAAVKSILTSQQFANEQIDNVCKQLKPVPGRMEVITNPDCPTVIIDYAHTPDALSKALVAVKAEFKDSAIWIVFGCGGDRDKGKRPLMAKIAEQYADYIIITDDNPRYESSAEIIADIILGFIEPDKVKIIADRKAAIEYALTHADKDDIILLAGKGHEIYQAVQGEQIVMDERVVIADIISGEYSLA